MKRAVFKLLVFLVLGAAVNVAVAWSLSAFVRVRPLPENLAVVEMPDGVMCGVWMLNGPGYGVIRWGDVMTRLDEVPVLASAWGVRNPKAVPLPRWSRFRTLPGPFAEPGLLTYIEEARGWPMLALSNETSAKMVDHKLVETVGHGIVVGMWPLVASRLSPQAKALPCEIIWPGFAINTAFYAAICWLFFATPFAYRRRRRIKRGLCPHCKYPVGASPVCTECGEPVKPKPAEVAV